MNLRERALAWIDADPDPDTRERMRTWMEAGDDAALAACFDRPLEFGTAGLRGEVGPGPARMNRAVVRRAAWALGRFLDEQPDLVGRPVVVGFDARPDSEEFARETVGVLTALGREVHFFPAPCPTPWVAYACVVLGAAAGVVVTASHNPRGANGYKVYDDQGIQIVAPWDERIAVLLETAPPARAIALGPAGRELGPEFIDEYFAPWQPPVDGPPLRVAYTPLHGVGLASMRRALEPSGRVLLAVVESQAEPDGTFPTVPFPNPEEPGAVDALLQLAEREGCALALASDPDADRLAVCIPEEGSWRRLSGDEVGALLADYLLSVHRLSAGADSAPRAVVSASVVSSPLVDAVARAHGARVERTLTGFKWLCRVATALPADEQCVFAYEEALGYATDARVRDKDGISAAVCFVDRARELDRRGSSVAARLRELWLQHGLWVACPHNVRLVGGGAAARMRRSLAELRQKPPTRVASFPVTALTDYARGAEERPPHLGAQDLLELELGPGGGLASEGRVLVRPSGTEPKLKLYVHLRGPLDRASPVAQVRADLLDEGRRVAEALCREMGL